MELTKSFPPADDLISYLLEIDYHKHFHTFLNAVKTSCIFIAALYTVLRNKWVENDCTERLQVLILNVIAAGKSFRIWCENVLIPESQSLYQDLRKVYVYLRTI